MCSTLYQPPSNYPEFRVERIELPLGVAHTLSALSGAAVILAYVGEGAVTPMHVDTPIQLRRGSVLFVAADTALKVHATSALTLFRATPNL